LSIGITLYANLLDICTKLLRKGSAASRIRLNGRSSQLLVLARKAAAAQSLDPALVCAVVEQESAWNPGHALRPLFFAKYVATLYRITNSASERMRAFQLGLMQVMDKFARETGFDALFLSALCDPEQD